jgi:hypothetical protein
MNRNEVVYGYQQNRNPFIDHPEFVSRIWDPTVAVGEMNHSISPRLYPNPAKNKIHLYLNSSSDAFHVSVYSLDGVRMIDTDVNGNGTSILECEQWPCGLYFIHMRDEQSGSTYVSKIIKTE